MNSLTRCLSLYLTKRKPRTFTMNLSKLSRNLILWIRSAESGIFDVSWNTVMKKENQDSKTWVKASISLVRLDSSAWDAIKASTNWWYVSWKKPRNINTSDECYLEEANENIESGGGVGNQLAVDVLAEGGEKARARLSIFISYQLSVFMSSQGRLTNVHKQNTVASQKYCRMSNLHDNRSSLQTIP